MNKVSWSSMGICLVILALILSSDLAIARIGTLQLPELIGQSDIIVIGRVGEMKKIAEVPKGNGRAEEIIENIIIPKRILKGKWPKGRPMSFKTLRSVRSGKQVWREDALSFPERGSDVVLFVSRDHRGKLGIVNGIQGLWPLGEDGKPLGMGFSHTIIFHPGRGDRCRQLDFPSNAHLWPFHREGHGICDRRGHINSRLPA